MKILMSIHDEFERNSGGPGATANLADALRKRGHDVDIISFFQLKGHRQFKRRIFAAYVAWHVARHGEYDLLDCSLGDAWLLATFWHYRPTRRRPVLVSRSHGLDHLAHEELLTKGKTAQVRYSKFYHLYKKYWRLPEVARSITGADAAVVLNGAELRYVIDRLGADSERCFQTRNGISQTFVERATALTNAAVPHEPARRIVFIGSFLSVKGITYLRDAMVRVLSERPDTTLTYFGVRHQPPVVLSTYPSELHHRISVVPSFTNVDLPRLLQGHHILVLPSLFEGYVLAPLEGMACGLVPVCSDIPGQACYVRHDQNGLLAPPRNSKELAEAILKLVDDGQTWRRLRTRALTTAIFHSWDEVALETEQIYAQAARIRDRCVSSGHLVAAEQDSSGAA